MKYLYLATLALYSAFTYSQTSDISITALRPTNRCSNGELNLSINDNLGPYDISWRWQTSPGNSFVIEQHNNVNGNNGVEDLDNLPPGTYIVNITNNICGSYEQSIELSSGLIFGDSDRIEANVDHVQTCGIDGTNDGSIEITRIIGVSPPYSIRWTGPGITPGTSGNSVENLRDGSYTVTIKTADGCALTRTFQICCCEQNINNPDRPKDANKTDRCVSTQQNFPVSILRDILFSPDDATSFNGELRINIDGGNQNNELTWTGPNGFFSNREHIFGLGVGEYCATVDNGCSEATRCFELVDCSESPLVLRVLVDNSCRSLGGLDISAGRISVFPEGGRPPFNYRWSNGSTNSTISRLPAGNYCVTVTDDRGCRPEVACIGVDYNPLVPAPATGNRCGEAYYCNGIEYELDFRPTQTYWAYDDPDCRVQHEYCTYDNPDRRMPSPPRITPYIEIGWGSNSCDILGVCPDGSGKLQVAAEGEQIAKYVVVPVPCQSCPGGVEPVCRESFFCIATYQGQEYERFISTRLNEALDISTVPAPIICSLGCALACDGVTTTLPGTNSPQCTPCDALQDSDTPGYNEELLLAKTNLTIADLILNDLSNGRDISTVNYSFPGKVTLGTAINDLKKWDSDFTDQTMFSHLTFSDLEPHITGSSRTDFNERQNGTIENQYFDQMIQVYPNPVDKVLIISLESLPKDKDLELSISLSNAQGKTVLQQKIGKINNHQTLDLSGIQPGAYILKLFGPFKGYVAKKIIVR